MEQSDTGGVRTHLPCSQSVQKTFWLEADSIQFNSVVIKIYFSWSSCNYYYYDNTEPNYNVKTMWQWERVSRAALLSEKHLKPTVHNLLCSPGQLSGRQRVMNASSAFQLSQLFPSWWKPKTEQRGEWIFAGEKRIMMCFHNWWV